jgi:CRISPR-associated protein Cas2
VWVFVLFDLPVGTKKERKAATRFRHALLDLGFAMTQFSVYLKFCAGKEQAEALARQVEGSMAPSGKVHLVQITDKQYENIVSGGLTPHCGEPHRPAKLGAESPGERHYDRH